MTWYSIRSNKEDVAFWFNALIDDYLIDGRFVEMGMSRYPQKICRNRNVTSTDDPWRARGQVIIWRSAT